tara:strand:+ start:62 stop:214 length:153 start_codon:yes stop_codon:yes gene_type:complete
MKNYKNIIVYSIWLMMVILWNFLCPEAMPIYDVIAAVILSFISIKLKKLF